MNQLRTLLTKEQYAAFMAAWEELRGGPLPGTSRGPDNVRVRDLSWPERESTVLHLSGSGVSWILKTAGNTAYSVGREARAREWTGSLQACGTVARLLWYDAAAPLALLDYLPGCDVLGSAWEFSPRVYHRAGAALALLHGAGARLDHGFAKGALTRTRARIAEIHARAPGGTLPDDLGEKLAEAEDFLASYRPRGVVVHPTHGDWQARNWLWGEPAGHLRVIDFGRFGWRPAAADLLELHDVWQHYPELEEAMKRGYREAGGKWPGGERPGGDIASVRCEAGSEGDIARLLRVARGVGHLWHRATHETQHGSPAEREKHA